VFVTVTVTEPPLVTVGTPPVDPATATEILVGLPTLTDTSAIGTLD
jgi:hypothetical protein